MNGTKRLWSQQFQVAGSSALTAAGFYLLDQGQNALRAIRVLDGAEQWSAGDRPFAVNGDAGAVADAGGSTVVVISGWVVSALQASSGVEIWSQRLRRPTGDAERFNPDLAVVANGLLVMSGVDLRATAIRISDGEREWRAALPDGSRDVKALRVLGNAVVTQTDVDLMAHDLATGKLLFTLKLAGDVEDGMNRSRHGLLTLPDSLPGNVLPVLGPDRLVGVDLTTGAVRFTVATTGRASYSVSSAGLLVADGKGLRGLDPVSGAERWTQPLPGTKWVMNLVDEQSLLQIDHGVCAVAVSDGKMGDCQHLVGMPEPDRALATSPNRVVLFTGHGASLFSFRDGKLRRFELSAPPLLALAEPYQVRMYRDFVAVRWKGNEVSMFQVK